MVDGGRIRGPPQAMKRESRARLKESKDKEKRKSKDLNSEQASCGESEK